MPGIGPAAEELIESLPTLDYLKTRSGEPEMRRFRGFVTLVVNPASASHETSDRGHQGDLRSGLVPRLEVVDLLKAQRRPVALARGLEGVKQEAGVVT